MRKFEISRRNKRKPGNFYNFPYKEFINGFREETKGNLVAILSRPTSRSSRFIKADGRFIKAGQPQWPFYQRWPLYQGRWPSQWPNGRFINQKRPNGQTIEFGARIAIFTISRVKNLSTAGPCAYLRFQEERKRNLVDPASSHMLVSQTKQVRRGQFSGFGARMAICTISRIRNSSTAFEKKQKET